MTMAVRERKHSHHLIDLLLFSSFHNMSKLFLAPSGALSAECVQDIFVTIQLQLYGFYPVHDTVPSHQ